MKVASMIAALMLMCSVAMPIDLQLGVDTDITMNKEVNLQKTGAGADYSAQAYDITLECALGDKIRITPKAGLNSMQIETDIGSTELELEGGVGWNVGIDVAADIYTVNVKDKYICDVSAAGSYRFSRTDIDKIDISVLDIDNPIETIASIHEWEVGAYASRDLSDVGVACRPYIGVVYSDLIGEIDANLSIVDINEDIEAKENIGIRLGVEAEPIKDLKVGVDVSLVDETSIGGRVSYLF